LKPTKEDFREAMRQGRQEVYSYGKSSEMTGLLLSKLLGGIALSSAGFFASTGHPMLCFSLHKKIYETEC
jgi:hypothetical protein